jgi:hypothetical protein
VPPLAYGRLHGPPPAVSRRRSAIRLDERETAQAEQEGAVRSLYGIDGARRRPTRDSIGGAVADEPSDTEVAARGAGHPSVPDLWRAESVERAERQRAAGEIAGLEERFDMLRIELETALDRRVRIAVDRMQITFDREIEALRNLNREEAKRIRSANDEAFVRIRVANTAELERIRAAIDEGVARLCSVLEGQLDRVWSANDVELERIRSAGADRLAEVHDLLMHKLDRIRTAQATASPVHEPDPGPAEHDVAPEQASAGERSTVIRYWLRRRRAPAAH